MAVAIEAFSVHVLSRLSLLAVDGHDELGASRESLLSALRFEGEAVAGRRRLGLPAAGGHLEATDDESADPMVRSAYLIRNFIEYSPPPLSGPPCHRRGREQDRPGAYLTHYIEPIRTRFCRLRSAARAGAYQEHLAEVFYYPAHLGRFRAVRPDRLASLMSPEIGVDGRGRVRLYAENVAEVLLNGWR